MSAANCLLTEDQFLCSICLDVFTDPVSTPCGHNFCKNCITKHWDVNASYRCPNCKEVFKSRPELKVNTFIKEMAAQFRQSAQLQLYLTMKKHQLVDPVESLESRMCEKQAELGKTKAKMNQMIQKRRLKIEELKHSVKLSDQNADREIAEGVQVFSALIETVQRNLNRLIDSVKEKQRRTKNQAEGFIRELEQEISELEKRSTEVEQISRSEDHLQLLQNFTSLNAAPPTKDWTEVRVHPPSYEGTVRRALNQLEETISEQMKKLICEAELKRVQQFRVNVTLDPDTAHPELILSDDGKLVKHGDMKKNLPQSENRFDFNNCVLAKQSFSAGRFYYEVQVKGKTKWDLGVARKSVNRKEDITLSPRNGFWVICLRNKNEYKACASPPDRLSLKSGPEKVGVFVDYEEGVVSFYDVDTAALIYSFIGCSFTEKLCLYFSPCNNDGGKNSAPLIISPVSQSLADYTH
ncbi:E3 ubiquitin-protein ligase TRIM21-like [Cheilinus undulatus]|uniref:E3 ubiquitin-protein ligase TRIM21-like n=1 Tax=Cheilinus undulatus TaxID=241271 RepID=UPI001BD33B49|nr:E3 ubiquitin-protein ligase TRIM21-like [Cheilinus undulatus]